ncbi:IS5 family transposase [Noviherbaspirillum sp. DKR-6]|uniref:IS5 family transposase n=1 Tax=Noviherbaspirillum pedocola TaxID=2801341 RepID=A0A934SXN0_9BURK|nr:IS5 family transposase [Noviherbaspirillum pedocola]
MKTPGITISPIDTIDGVHTVNEVRFENVRVPAANRIGEEGSQAIRRFIGIDPTVDVAPDATTLLKFRRLLETHKLTRVVFDTINAHLAKKGLLLKEARTVGATIIAAPSSTKNQSGERDADMHQTKKGKTWHFGMKVHIGVDADSGLVHTVVATAANTADVTQAHALLHGEETHAFGDVGYTGVDKHDKHRGRTVKWHVAMKPSRRRLLPDTPLGKLLGKLLGKMEQAKVEHPFHVVKNLFKHRKTRYRGLAKNTTQLMTLFGLANLKLAKKRLMALPAQGAS